MEPIHAAVVGTGNIAGLHAEALRRLGDEVRLVGAVDTDAGRLSAFCDRYDVPARHPDLASLLAKERPELVHVCTPPGSHHELALGCLRAGVNVLVEKPPTLNLGELDELAEAERRHGAALATVFQHRFGSGALRLRAMLDAGVLGRPLLAVCHTTWFRPQSYFDVEWRGRWATEGGGPTMGHGIHQMDLLCAVLGDWTEVSALARRQARRSETEDLSMAQVSFANGAVASVVNSLVSVREESYLRFDFERATVELTHLYGYGDDDWRITPAPEYAEQVLAAWRTGPAGVRSSHQAQFAEVLRSLRGGTPPPVTSAEARRTMRLVAGVYASAFTRRPVRPDELGADSPFYRRMQGDGPRW
ncbi:Gfo/Idh/MocA family oxidoreductase [Micromonospora sp. WMMD1102]|uniref:Gfo/Idh/MocA family protein n=1 Tax=Micromonospora sp. WMMD1102 TaxID=3016105 RepID=UPI002414FD3A|nr:Gfo/Idh/MocA family oxidoreductase [Micromonospora sp. WMMD1102]MDG4786808.1 Gfo/Idh/MocA family oxidoreductase [Micromonospora sp. WMMD1102]